MLLEKLNGTVPCLLDTTTIPAEELTMSPSRSIANPGLNDSLAAGSLRPSNGDSPSHPYHRTFSPHFHNFVEQCLQRSPDARYPAGHRVGFWEQRDCRSYSQYIPEAVALKWISGNPARRIGFLLKKLVRVALAIGYWEGRVEIGESLRRECLGLDN